MRPAIRALCMLLTALAVGLPASGGASESFLTLVVQDERITGEWLLPVDDLAAALQIAPGAEGDIAWPQLEPRRDDIKTRVQTSLTLRAQGVARDIAFDDFQYGQRDGTAYVRARLAVVTAAPVQEMNVACAPFPDAAPPHRCQLHVTWPDASVSRAVLAAGDAAGVRLDAADAQARGFVYFFKSGVWHIWIGYDHILFLLALLIPAVYRRRARGREPVSRMGPALVQVAAIVTAFTVTHSITLTCAAMGWIDLPSRWVESVIALSVMAAALYNLLPTTAGARGVWLALAFGLLHGFGFASVLGQQDMQGVPSARVLLGFNLGVEVGQLAIVALFFPVAYLLRKTRFYRIGVVYGGSIAIALCALLWFVDRAF